MSLGLTAGLAVLALAGAQFASAQTTIYNVQFATTAENDGGGVPVHYVGMGALGKGGTFFNFDEVPGMPATATFADQKDSQGKASTVSVTVTGGQFYNATDGTPTASSPAALLGSYCNNNTSTAGAATRAAGTFTLSHLPANTPYRIYLYALNGHFYNPYAHKTTFTIGTASASTDGTAENSFSEGHNYVVLSGETTADGVVMGTYVAADGGEADFNGLQISLGASPPAP